MHGQQNIKKERSIVQQLVLILCEYQVVNLFR